MMKRILALLLLLPIVSSSSEGGPVQLTPENTVVNSAFPLTGGRGKIHVVVRNDGEAMGRNYLIELRPQCSAADVDVQDLAVAVVKSTCGVDSKSLRFNSVEQNISIRIYEPDAADYNRQTRDNPLTAKLDCLKKPKVQIMPFDSYCRK